MKTFKEELQEFIEIYNYINDMEDRLLHHSTMNKDEAYRRLFDKVFSGGINEKLQMLYPFYWYNPDAGYDDDYNSWKYEADNVAERIKEMLAEPDEIL